MARNVTKLTPEENKFFHINYDYMWKKLNTAPYYVSGAGECPVYIRNEEELPSYVNLSKCRNPEYVPSMTIVNKIVNFYNYNITPEVTTFQFLREDLSLTDSSRSQNIKGFDEKYIGTYYGYYYGDSSKKKVNGAIIKIYKENNVLKATAITGIQNDKQLFDEKLSKLFSKDFISLNSYNKYYDSLEISQKRTTFYEGIVNITPRFLIIYLEGLDNEDKKMVINLSTDDYAHTKEYLSGLSFSVLISEQFNLQFFKLGVVRANFDEIVPFSLSNEDVGKMLEVTKTENERIVLEPKNGRDWYEMVIQNED